MKIIFAGTPDFALPTLKALLASSHEICAVYTKPDRKAGRGQKLTFTPVKQFALNSNLPIYQPESFRDPTELEKIKSLAADVLIDVAYGVILPETILQAPRYGCVNIHPSLLPKWRGAAPIQRAILAGDKETGVTIMQMDNGLDTGNIIKQVIIPIFANDATATLYPALAKLGAQLLMETLNEIQQHGKIISTPQDNAKSSYAKKFTKEDAKIVWQESAVEIDRMIRAFNPWPVAYSNLGDETIRIWQAKPVLSIKTAQQVYHTILPGTLMKSDEDNLEVMTGEGILRIEQLQLAGGKILSVKNMLHAKQALFATGKVFCNNPVA